MIEIMFSMFVFSIISTTFYALMSFLMSSSDMISKQVSNTNAVGYTHLLLKDKIQRAHEHQITNSGKTLSLFLDDDLTVDSNGDGVFYNDDNTQVVITYHPDSRFLQKSVSQNGGAAQTSVIAKNVYPAADSGGIVFRENSLRNTLIEINFLVSSEAALAGSSNAVVFDARIMRNN